MLVLVPLYLKAPTSYLTREVGADSWGTQSLSWGVMIGNETRTEMGQMKTLHTVPMTDFLLQAAGTGGPSVPRK